MHTKDKYLVSSIKIFNDDDFKILRFNRELRLCHKFSAILNDETDRNAINKYLYA